MPYILPPTPVSRYDQEMAKSRLELGSAVAQW